MRSRTRSPFTCVRTESAVLPPDLLVRISAGDQDLKGLTPESYHLAKGERISEVATRAWNRLQGAWVTFRQGMEKLSDSDLGTTLTRERWLFILLQELGYGRLTPHRAEEIDGRTYPISHMWQNTPIHLVGFRVKLDTKSPGVAGAARVSPHGLVQEFLNRSDDHLWGFVSNGLVLRILRDNVSITRSAYVEFDLQGMMEGEQYSDFLLLFLLAHQSRVEVPEGKTPEHCWLERWHSAAAEKGVRALDDLRTGVQQAIEAFGSGFLAHPDNRDLRARLRDGSLDKQDYYRQVLRVVYRLLFLFVAEDRELLYDPAVSSDDRKIYLDYYSTQHLRHLADSLRGTRHPDLWRSLRLVFTKLRTGCRELALPALGGFLFSAEATPDLDSAELKNSDLLAAIRHLAFTIDGNVRRPVDYRNLGPEELGSVYESLLEMHPRLNADAATFSLEVAAGSERKTTGSYYTHASLVNSLLDSALDPVLDTAAKKPDPERAILDLKVCDPASGSGHFLIGAAHRIAKRLASVRTGADEPGIEAQRTALREVIGRSIYAVDINPMAVELCKISLWMEAMEPGKALGFLDHHIKCGNSLLGTTPALMANGIPGDAFKPIEGDDKTMCKDLKRENKQERGGQLMLSAPIPRSTAVTLTSEFTQLAAQDDATLSAREQKAARYHAVVRSAEYEHAKFLADAWCGAFVLPKRAPDDLAITHRVFRDWQANPDAVPPEDHDQVERISRQYNFFHWHLAFPDVFRLPSPGEVPENEAAGWSGGFDCVLGNPPWERIKLQEKEFFAQRSPEIATAPNAAARRRMIAQLQETDPPLWRAFQGTKRIAEGWSHLVRDTARYPLCGRGDVNTYAVFAELNRSLISSTGRVGRIVPSGIATDDTTKYFFRDLMESRSLASLYDFENRRAIFPGVHRSYKFCLLTLAGPARPVHAADFVFFALEVPDLAMRERHFALTAEEIDLLNPNTHTCPVFRSKHDAELTKKIYRHVPVLIREAQNGRPEENPWGITFNRMFDMSNDSHLFRTREQLEAAGFHLVGNRFIRPSHDGRGIEGEGAQVYLPLYEAKMIWHFDHRFGTYHGVTSRSSTHIPTPTSEQYADPAHISEPWYWVPGNEVKERLRDWKRRWLLGFRRITNTTNERTMVASVISDYGSGDVLPVCLFQRIEITRVNCLLSNLVSIIFDYIARQKIGGTHMDFHYLNQLPVLQPSAYTAEDLLFIVPRVMELVYTAWDIKPFADDVWHDADPTLQDAIHTQWEQNKNQTGGQARDLPGWIEAYPEINLPSPVVGEGQGEGPGIPLPPFKWDDDRRAILRAELDAYYAVLYGLTEEELRYILDPKDVYGEDFPSETFRVLKEKETRLYGEYRTKRLILEAWQQLPDTDSFRKLNNRTTLDPPARLPIDGQDGSVPERKLNPSKHQSAITQLPTKGE